MKKKNKRGKGRRKQERERTKERTKETREGKDEGNKRGKGRRKQERERTKETRESAEGLQTKMPEVLRPVNNWITCLLGGISATA